MSSDVFEFVDPGDGDLTQFRVENGEPQWRWKWGEPDRWSTWRFANVFSDEWCGDVPEFLAAHEWCRERMEAES